MRATARSIAKDVQDLWLCTPLPVLPSCSHNVKKSGLKSVVFILPLPHVLRPPDIFWLVGAETHIGTIGEVRVPNSCRF